SCCVSELIEAMALLALRGARLPAPERVPRAVSGVEVRINATNQALQPHAGGLIRGWSKPIPGEIRFDQGIGARNPDTGSFIYYALAGAYDSNVALLLTDGDNRRHNYERMAEVLRCMDLRGDDLQTNAPVHYGLINWFLGKGPMAEPDTRFMASYLAAVGALAQLARDVDLELAAADLAHALPDDEARALFARKETLLLRPIQRLLANAHVLGGFIGRFDGVLWTTRKPSGAQRAEGERRSGAREPSGAQRAEGERRSVAGEPSGAQRAEGERRSVAGEPSGAQRAEGERRSVAGEPSGAQRAEGERRSVGW